MGGRGGVAYSHPTTQSAYAQWLRLYDFQTGDPGSIPLRVFSCLFFSSSFFNCSLIFDEKNHITVLRARRN